MSNHRTILCVNRPDGSRSYYGPDLKRKPSAKKTTGTFGSERAIRRGVKALSMRKRNTGARVQVLDVQEVSTVEDPAVWTDWVDLNLRPHELEQIGNPVRVVRNSRYLVMVNEAPVGETNHLSGDPPPELLHLSIKRHDQQPLQDWRDLQRIKNDLVGPEHEAVQLYPRESRLVDAANQVHLFVFKEPGLGWPIGWRSGRVVTSEGKGGATQRPRDEDDPNEDTTCTECVERATRFGARVAEQSPCSSCGLNTRTDEQS